MKKLAFVAIRQCKVNSLLVLLLIALFAVTDFFSAVINVELTFSFLLVLRLSLDVTTLRTRPVNSHCTCSSIPDLSAHRQAFKLCFCLEDPQD